MNTRIALLAGFVLLLLAAIAWKFRPGPAKPGPLEQLAPGNPATLLPGRHGLFVSGDAADPLSDVTLSRNGQPRPHLRPHPRHALLLHRASITDAASPLKSNTAATAA